MRRKKHGRSNRRSIFGAIILIIIILLLIFSIIKTDKAVRPVAAMQAEHYAKSSASEIISEAVLEYLEENRFSYEDFAAVLYDENGNVVSVEAIPYNINKVQSGLTLMINRKFSSASETYSKIPLGSLTGSYMLAGKGPYIRIRICPAEKASVELKSSFEAAGINQTKHRISAVVTAEIESSLPIYSFETEVSFEFLLAENVLIGDVPEYSRMAFAD